MPWWCKSWQHSGYNHTRVKQNLPRRPRRTLWSSWSRQGNPKSFTLKIPWNLASLARNYPCIIVRQHHTDQKQMELPKVPYVEWKKGHLWCYCSPVWVTNGGRILWNVTAICETFKISCLMGRHHTKGFSENHSRSSNTVWSNGRISPYFCERPIWTASVWSKSLARYISRLRIFRGRNLERRHYGRRHWRIRGDGRIRTPRQKAQCKGSVNAAKKWKLHFPSRRWNSENLWETTAPENIHLRSGSSGTRRRTRNSSRKIRWITFSKPTSRRLNAGWGS